MKKYLCLLLIFCLTLCGCGRRQPDIVPDTPPTQPTQQTTEPTSGEVPTEPSPVYDQIPMVAISLPPITESITADDGNLICSITYQGIELSIPDQNVADQIILRYQNRQAAQLQSANAISLLAQDSYHSGDTWTPYFFDITYSPARIDHNVLSLFGKTVQFTGGNHPYTECSALNYNMLTGEWLTLGSILTNVSAKQSLCSALIESAGKVAQEKQLYDDYPQIIEQRFAKEESYDEDWFFSTTGLCFFFSPYEIAPYVSGSVVIEVPYDQLSGIIDDSFFPPEEDQSVGTLCIQNAKDVDYQKFSQIAQITTCDDGDTAFLYAAGLIRDIQIFSANGTPIFRTFALSPGDGIKLTADFSQEYHISYRNDNETVNELIRFEIQDGSFSLNSYNPE